MAGNYNLPGGSLTVTQQDPLELALKQAQLLELLQKPATERAQLALQQFEATQRGQIAAGQHQLGTGQLSLDQQKLAETLPIERGKLTVDQQRLIDENRYRTGSLAEETRFHNVTAGNEAARVKAGLVGDTMTHMLPAEMAGQLPKGTVEASMTALGYPELAASMKSVSDRATLAKAIAFADQNKMVNEKQFGAVTAGLPPGTDETFRNAAWNRYKSVHPEVYGKDVATAAEAELKSPDVPTAAAPTTTGSALTNAYVASGAGSPSVGWAMGPDSPLASATPGVSQFGPKNPQMGLVDPTTNDVLPLPGGTIAGTGTVPTAKPPPPPVDQLVKTAAAPQVAPVVAGAPVAVPTGPPQPAVTTNALSFGNQPIPISLGFSSGQSEQARELEAERKRQALLLMTGSR